MGCDIHDYVEIKTERGWEMLGNVFGNPYREGQKHNHPYDWRNYSLFGLLAGVRDNSIPPIDHKRGVPEDASDEYLKIVREWDSDGHSHSYLTLRELLEYPFYDEKISRSGYVSPVEYKIFKEDGVPSSYCGGVAGTCVFNITNAEMDEYLKDGKGFIDKNIKSKLFEQKRAWERYDSQCNAYKETVRLLENLDNLPPLYFYTKVDWQESVRDCIGSRWFKVMEELKQFAPDGDYDKIRMVFFFDN